MKAVFIGAESHFAYTKSSFFFIDTLKEYLGSLAVGTGEWRWIHLSRRKRWDLVVFWQGMPERWELDCLDADNVVLVPMFDDCPKTEGFWSNYRDCKVLCFSRNLADLLRDFGLHVFTAQYFPPVPSNGIDWGRPGLSAFFWPRKHELNWSHMRPLLQGGSFSRIHIHQTDNLSVVPLGLTSEESSRLPLSTSSWFESHQEYLATLRQCNVFLAPRRFEGIGLSFLEAMSLGMAVISPDNPTMNEYIRTGQNGYLFDPENPIPPPWDQAETWGKAARQACILGREAWLRSVPAMIQFLSEPHLVRARATRDRRRQRAIRSSLLGYVRYSLLKVAKMVRNSVFPRWKQNRDRKRYRFHV